MPSEPATNTSCIHARTCALAYRLARSTDHDSIASLRTAVFSPEWPALYIESRLQVYRKDLASKDACILAVAADGDEESRVVGAADFALGGNGQFGLVTGL